MGGYLAKIQSVSAKLNVLICWTGIGAEILTAI